MSMESSLLTQINVENPLPTMVEVEISRTLNASMKRAFVFFYLLAAEKVSALSPFLPYADEIYLAFSTAFERFLLFHADTTFTELMFGLRRAQITGPPAAMLGHRLSVAQLLTGAGGWAGVRWLLLGPRPVSGEEERAVGFAAGHGAREGAASTGAALSPAAAADPLDGDHLTGGPSAAPAAEYKASELMSASRASFGYLRLSPLSRRQRVISLFLLTVKPYVEKRVKVLYANETDRAPDAVALRAAYALRYPARAQLKRVFFGTVFPLLHVLHKSSELLFKVLYLCELTPYSSPFHRLFNIIVKRGSFEESASVSPKAQRALTLARVLIFVVFFSFQIFEFTRSTGLGSAGLMNDPDESALPIPPAPVWGVDVQRYRRRSSAAREAIRRRQQQRSVGESGAGEGEREGEAPEEEPLGEVRPGRCPVCAQSITNAAVLATSGVLGCYPCLQQVLSDTHVCPVTGKPTTVAHIRRVFEC